MSNQKNNKFSEFILGKGFYFVLALCIAGAGVAGWAAMNRPLVDPTPAPPIGVIDNPSPDWQNPPFENADKPQPEIPVTPPPAPDVPVETPDEQPAAIPQTPTYVKPVQGEVLQAFSGETLVKNETLGDWRTHNGIDIKCDKGADVKAMANGKVSSVSNDPVWGYTVVIDHGSDLISVYCGLDKNILVSKGAAVKAGQIIGKVDYIPAESKMPDHFHFEVKKAGKYINPADLIK